MCEFKWQWFGTRGGDNASMTPILTSLAHVLPNLGSYSTTSHSHLSTDSVVCRIDSARFSCNKYCIRARWQPLLLLSYVAFNPRHASSPLLTSVFFTVTRAFPLHSKVQLRIVILETLFNHCCGQWSCLPPSKPNAVLQSTWDSKITCVL